MFSLNNKILSIILICLFITLAFNCLVFSQDISLDNWIKIKGKHFIVMYQRNNEKTWSKKVLRKAEKYYNNVAQNIGYVRYDNFWTWDKRARIIIYPNQEMFAKRTGQPDWSRGYADQDNITFQSRAIVTYVQNEEFLDGILPHEIGHLVLRDVVGEDKNIPVWFDEGVAQLQEKNKLVEANYAMKFIIKNGKYIDFNKFAYLNIRKEKDPLKVAIFYAQSVSLVDYIIKTFGSDKFGKLCSNMRDGSNFSNAFNKVYYSKIESLAQLEKKWLRYMKSY